VFERVLAHLLLLMGDVLAFAGLAHTVTLDGLAQDHGRLSGVGDGGSVSGIDLVRIVPAAVQAPDVVVAHARDHCAKFGILAEEMLTHERAVDRLVSLVLAVDRFFHALAQQALGVFREQRIPARTPDHFDDVPAGTTEVRFEFLDDLAIAAYRAVESLQIAVDDEDQIVEFLAGCERGGTEGLRLVHFAIAHEGPDLAALRGDQIAVFEITQEARLVDRHDRTEAHRYCRELPEARHQPGVGIGRQALAIDLLAEVVEVVFRQQAEQVGARIDAWRRMALEEHEIATVLGARRVPEMAVADFVEGRGAGVARDMPTEFGILAIGLDHHGHCVPAIDRSNTPFEFRISGRIGLAVRWNGVDIRRTRRVGQVDP